MVFRFADDNVTGSAIPLWIRSAEVGSLHLSDWGRSASSPYLAHACKHTYARSQTVHKHKARRQSQEQQRNMATLECSPVQRCLQTGKPSEVWHFSAVWAIKKRKERVCTLLSQGSYFMKSTRLTGQRRVKRPLHICLGRGRIFWPFVHMCFTNMLFETGN